MLKALIGRKLNMTQVYDTHGRITPVTKLRIEPNVVLSFREKDKEGYKAVQVGIGAKKHPTKPLIGHVKKAKIDIVPLVIREVDYDGDLKAGQKITVDEVFRKGNMVDIVGTSKGKGFAGVIKRWGFHGGPKTHGQSDRHRAPGSIGSGTTPGRVQKGLKMAGHMGNAQVSVFGLEVMEVDKEEGILLVKGSVPGFTGAELLIKKSKKKKEVYHEPEIPALPNLGSVEEEEEKPAEAEGTEVPQAEATSPTGGEVAEEVKAESSEG